jgi:hypothetical protein
LLDPFLNIEKVDCIMIEDLAFFIFPEMGVEKLGSFCSWDGKGLER